ncbi:MAG: metallophosphoesterase [Thermoguttaceae bacterium]
MPRTIAIGDIHGCLAALESLLAAVAPRPDDTLVLLGDYVDRGPDCRRTLDRLLRLDRECHLIPLLGNHDEMVLAICDGRTDLLASWLSFGGSATLASYGATSPTQLPPEHIAFLRSCRLWHETQRHFFLHANYLADLPLDAQPRETLLWESLKTRRPGPHCSGKTAVVGHTSQKSGEILDLGYLKCIDTCCYGAGWLTALHIESGRVWQADKKGRLRE